MLFSLLFTLLCGVGLAKMHHNAIRGKVSRDARGKSGRDRTGFEPRSDFDQPNIIFILMDDMGYGDIAIVGAEYDTPNLDALYRDSVVLNYHYIGLVCSPTRSQLLSGRYAWRYGNSHQKAFADATFAALPAALPTLGNLLSDYTNYNAYYTGKWHIGMSTNEHIALSRGWKEFHGFHTSGIDYVTKIKKTKQWGEDKFSFLDWWANDEVDWDTQDIFSTVATESKIEQFIETSEASNKENNPFFIFAAFQSPHMPLISLVDFGYDCSEKYAMINEYRRENCEHIIMLDDSIGVLTKYLKDNDLWDNTMIVFTTDNGASGRDSSGGSNYPLRGEKGNLFEGGIRTLAFVGGGYIPESQRGTTRDEFIHVVDWIPTILSLAGADIDDVAEDLQNVLYSPMAETVAMTTDGKMDNKLSYLMSDSFDGYDLSEWLIYGKKSKNKRTEVPLSMNTYGVDSPSFKINIESEMDSEIDNNDNDIANSNLHPRVLSHFEKHNIKYHTNDVGPSTGIGDFPSERIGVIFTSKITSVTYKFMYLQENPTDIVRRTYCKYSDSMIGKIDALNGVSKIDLSKDVMTEVDDLRMMCEDEQSLNFTSNKLLFDFYNDPYEETNLFDSVDPNDNDNDLIAVYNEALDLVDSYIGDALYHEVLECHAIQYYNASKPSNFNQSGVCPFFTWDEYIETFETECNDELHSEAVKLLFTSKYDEYVTSYQAFEKTQEEDTEEFNVLNYLNTSEYGNSPLVFGVIIMLCAVAFVAHKNKAFSIKTVDAENKDCDEFTPLKQNFQML